MTVSSKMHLDRRWTVFTWCIIGGLAGKIFISSLFVNFGGIRQWLQPGQSHAAAAVRQDAELENLPRLMATLKTERQALAARESSLAEKEYQLNSLKKEIESRLTELTGIQERVNRLLEEEQKIQDEKQRHLIATLESMPTDRSGKLIEKMDEEMVVQLMRRMNGKEAGKILGSLEAEKAARLSKRLFH